MLWSNLVDVLRGSLFVLAHWCGGSFGAAILLASAAMRVALSPITFAATRRGLIRERAMRALAPEIDQLKKRYAKQPNELGAAMQKLYADNGVAVVDGRSLLRGLASFPPAAALYTAVRSSGARSGGFLWIADLAKPDRVLAIGASVIAGGLAWVSAAAPAGRQAPQMLPVLLTAGLSLFFLWHFSAGVALYSVSNSIVGAVERMIAQRTLESSKA